MATQWYEIILMSMLAGSLIASLGLAAYLEYKRYRAYKAMLKQQEKFYIEVRSWVRSDLILRDSELELIDE